MPRAKIDYVVSFSSEDPEHPASNLLLREVSKKKWLCQRGETSCSVVLQLPRTVKITGVHIGAYHTALVEVLVGRSETSSEQFQVLVPSSVFISREESRRDEPVLRVRSFGADALSAPARDQRWDRVRVVCSQPHNKHCQFGLSFVHIDEAACAPQQARLLQLDTFSSDDDDFKPGELFAKHLQKTSEEAPSASSNTGAQIRQATSQALKNIAESSTKLIKTPISKPGASRAQSPAAERSERARDALLYTRHDAAPHARIDRVLSRHQRDSNQDKSDNTNHNTRDNTKTKEEPKMKQKTKDDPKRTPKRKKSESPPRPQRNHDKPTSAQNKHKEERKRRRSNSQEQRDTHGLTPGPLSTEPHTLLSGCVLVLSGYENPQRAALRALALALGARVERDWGPTATHLICAFPNTPKLRALRARHPAAPAARAAWLQHVRASRRLLPWQWYATEPARHVQPAPSQLRDDEPQPDPDSGGDTDDEIEKVLQAQKKRRLSESKTNDDAHKREPSPADDVTTDEEDGPRRPRGGAGSGGPGGGALPDMFEGLRFALDAAPAQARHMARYVLAYGGLVLTMSEVDEGSEVDYIVRGAGTRSAPGAGTRSAPVAVVSAAWLASCHRAQALLPHT